MILEDAPPETSHEVHGVQLRHGVPERIVHEDVTRAALLQGDPDSPAILAMLDGHVYGPVRLLVDAVRALHAREAPVDHEAVIAQLGDRINAAGGAVVLRQLGTAPYSDALEHARCFANRLQHGALPLRLRNLAERIENGASPEEIADEHARAIAPAVPKPVAPRPALVRLGDLVRRMGEPRRHLATGIDTLDRATAGGPRIGDIVVLNGHAGSGKTGLACDIVARMQQAGAFIAIAAWDEPETGLASRFLQRLGHERDALEVPTPEYVAGAASDVDAHDVVFARAEDGHTLETMGDAVFAAAPGRDVVFVVDSVQKAAARCVAAAGAQTDIERINAAMHAFSEIARRGALVIVLSQMNRSGQKRESERTDDLTSAMGSSAIEYDAQLMLVLRRPRNSATINVAVPKNRIRPPQPSFALSIDERTAIVTEVPLEDDESDETVERKATTVFGALKERVLEVVRNHHDLTSANRVAAMVKGDRTTKLDAVRALVAEGRLVKLAGAFRVAVPTTEGGGS